jgi:hypothetical protein
MDHVVANPQLECIERHTKRAPRPEVTPNNTGLRCTRGSVSTGEAVAPTEPPAAADSATTSGDSYSDEVELVRDERLRRRVWCEIVERLFDRPPVCQNRRMRRIAENVGLLRWRQTLA